MFSSFGKGSYLWKHFVIHCSWCTKNLALFGCQFLLPFVISDIKLSIDENKYTKRRTLAYKNISIGRKPEESGCLPQFSSPWCLRIHSSELYRGASVSQTSGMRCREKSRLHLPIANNFSHSFTDCRLTGDIIGSWTWQLVFLIPGQEKHCPSFKSINHQSFFFSQLNNWRLTGGIPF